MDQLKPSSRCTGSRWITLNVLGYVCLFKMYLTQPQHTCGMRAVAPVACWLDVRCRNVHNHSFTGYIQCPSNQQTMHSVVSSYPHNTNCSISLKHISLCLTERCGTVRNYSATKSNEIDNGLRLATSTMIFVHGHYSWNELATLFHSVVSSLQAIQ